MIPKCSGDFVKFLLELAIALNFFLSTSSMKQCKRKNIRNLGIKLCQLKCNENNLCSDFESHIETLPCRLSRNDSKKNEKQEGHMSLSRNNSNVLTGPCASETCRLAQRCFETRPRKAICEQGTGVKRNHHEVDKQDSFTNSPLHDACRKGYLDRVRHILSQGLVDINSRDEKHGRTPLMVAAKEGHCKILFFLSRKGADIAQVDNDGKNILHWAYKGGHAGIVRCVLPQYGIDIKNMHHPPVMQAAQRGQIDVVDFLLCMGGNVSQVDNYGRNVLHWACTGGHVSMVKYLLSQGSVDINGRARGRVTPLMIATMTGHGDVVELLVCMGANVSHVDDHHNNVLHYASTSGHAKIVKYIVSKDTVDVNSRGRFGRTPLMLAANAGRITVFDQLMWKGGLTRLVDDNGYNILHLASLGGRVEMVKHILSQNLVDINARNKDGETAAMIAKLKRKRHVYYVLVSRGCPVK